MYQYTRLFIVRNHSNAQIFAMTHRFLSSVFAFLTFFTLVALTLAQDVVAPSTVPVTVPDASSFFPKADFAQTETATKDAEFVALDATSRAIAKTLTALKRELPGANAARQKEIQNEYMELIAKGKELFKKMVEVGFEANREAPNRNQYVVDFLYGMTQYEFERDNFEEAVRIFKEIEPHQILLGGEQLYVCAGLSAMVILDVENATKWLKIAEEHGLLQKMLQEWQKTNAGKKRVQAFLAIQIEFNDLSQDWEKEKIKRAEETQAGTADPTKKLPRVKLSTTKGDIVLELFEDQAPNTVANFISLVELGFYDGSLFHRVLPQFMAQGGRGTRMADLGYMIDCETKKTGARKHFRGSISMANAGPDTNGSEFFLTFMPTSFLDGKYTVFGHIVEGMEVLADIQRVDPDDQEAMIPERDKIVKAVVVNKRDHAYVPVKNNKR